MPPPRYRTPFLGSTHGRENSTEGQSEGVSRQHILAASEPDHPHTGTVRHAVDLCVIHTVNPDKKTLTVESLTRHYLVSGVQWACDMIDPTTGNGVYTTPIEGMVGVYLNIEGEKFFIRSVGAIDPTGKTGYSNGREEMPLGSWAAKTSRETKLMAFPNLILAAGANFARMLIKRVDKSIFFLFYQWTMQSLNGVLQWTNDIVKRTSKFVWEFQDSLPPPKTIDGNDQPTTNIYEVKMEMGTLDEPDEDQILKLNIGKSLSPIDAVTTESVQIKAFRQLLITQLTDRKVSSIADLAKKGNEDLAFAYLEFASPQDFTQTRLVESIVDAASYTDAALPDALNGVKELSPKEDSIEDLNTGELTSVPPSNRDKDGNVFGLDEATQVFIPANPVENKVSPEGVPSVASDLIKQARDTKENTPSNDINSRFRTRIDRQGNLEVFQSQGEVAWLLQAIFQLVTKKGPVDIDAGDGIRIQGREGMLFLGFKEAAIVLTKEGKIKLVGRAIDFEVWEDSGQDFGSITNNGTTFSMAPGGVSLQTNASIKLRGAQGIDIGSGQPSDSARTSTTEEIRQENQELTGLTDLVASTLVDTSDTSTTQGASNEPAPAQ
jgi:hypothetical protein